MIYNDLANDQSVSNYAALQHDVRGEVGAYNDYFKVINKTYDQVIHRMSTLQSHCKVIHK